jgi:hypothetical protein
MGKRILLVDPNGLWSGLVSQKLTELGHTVTVAKYESVSKSLRLQYDLVVLGGASFNAVKPVAQELGNIRMPYIVHPECACNYS